MFNNTPESRRLINNKTKNILQIGFIIEKDFKYSSKVYISERHHQIITFKSILFKYNILINSLYLIATGIDRKSSKNVLFYYLH